MSFKNGTKVRLVLLATLLFAATAMGQLADRDSDKNASGCSWVEAGGVATVDGCSGGGDSCWDCLYSDPFGYIHCYESYSTSGWSYYCSAWGPENQM